MLPSWLQDHQQVTFKTSKSFFLPPGENEEDSTVAAEARGKYRDPLMVGITYVKSSLLLN